MKQGRNISRRDYLKATGVIAAGICGINHFDVAPTHAETEKFGLGPLEADPAGILDLPAGFRYTAFSQTGDWMDDNLKGFRGRVSRDDWIGQARILAAGGETDFSTRVDKGEVY